MRAKIDHALASAFCAALVLAVAGAAAAAPRPLKASMPKAPRPAEAPACADFSFPVYFRDKSDRLTVQARDLIRQSAAFAAACPLADIKVVGLDSEGADLSRKRADAVSRALAEGGYPQPGHGIVAAEPVARGELLASKTEVYVH